MSYEEEVGDVSSFRLVGVSRPARLMRPAGLITLETSATILCWSLETLQQTDLVLSPMESHALDTSRKFVVYWSMPATATSDLDRAVALFHALSDVTRLSALEMLRDGEKCVCELQDQLDVAQSRLSFHLKVLKDAGLVEDRKEGRWSYYTIVPNALDEAHDLVVDFLPKSFGVSKTLRVGAAAGKETAKAGCCR